MKAGAPQFSDDEYARRYEQVRKNMESEKIDCLLVPVSENMTYLTNITMAAFGAYLLIPLSGAPVLFVNPVLFRNRDASNRQSNLFGAYSGGEGTEALLETSYVQDMRGFMPGEHVNELGGWLKEKFNSENVRVGVVGREIDYVTTGGSNIGITGPLGINPIVSQGLQQSLPNFEFLDATKVVVKARMIKSQEEISSVRNAARVADACSLAIRDELRKPGCKEADVYAAYWDALYRNGGGGSWWFMVSTNPTSSPKQQQFHIHPYDLSIRDGDIVMAEILPNWNDGYTGHAEACYVVGENKQQEMFEKVNGVCLESYQAVVDSLKPGATAAEIIMAADEPILSNGFQRCAPSVYGLGPFGMDAPMIGIPMGPDSDESACLSEDMTVLVISHVFDPETQVCVRAGTTHLITGSGSECFNDESIPLGLVTV